MTEQETTPSHIENFTGHISPQKISQTFQEKLLKTTAFTYSLILFLSIIGGGSIIRLYGDTCGLNVFDPTTWLRAAVVIGSPWCKGLNWLGYTATCIVEHLWLHLIGLSVTTLVAYIPGKFKNRKAGEYTDNTCKDR
jgi:hypothetical protein